MEKFMNEPVEKVITDEDILNDYRIYNDKRKVARIHGITVKELNEILKRNPEVDKQ